MYMSQEPVIFPTDNPTRFCLRQKNEKAGGGEKYGLSNVTEWTGRSFTKTQALAHRIDI